MTDNPVQEAHKAEAKRIARECRKLCEEADTWDEAESAIEHALVAYAVNTSSLGDPLHTAADLSASVAEARRAAFEEAAAILDAEADRVGPVLNGANVFRYWAERIRAKGTT